jgi:hypothetical protein
MELLLPRPDSAPVRVRAEVVRVEDGQVGLRAIGQRLYNLGGRIDL